MGGSFNPIHLGHLVAAEEALERFGLSKVIFMPTGRPWHKEEAETVSAENRYLMTVMATADNPAFEVSRLEVERDGPTYTTETVAELHSAYGNDYRIYFITGADAILDIMEWKDHASLARYCRFIAVTRPGYELSRLRTLIETGTELPKIEILEVTALAISSTDLRARVRERRSIRYLVPAQISNFIKKSGLYL